MQTKPRLLANFLVKPTKNEPYRGGHGSPGEFEDAEATVPLAVPCGLAPGPRFRQTPRSYSVKMKSVGDIPCWVPWEPTPRVYPLGAIHSREASAGGVWCRYPPSSLGYVLPKMAHQMLGDR